MFKIEWTPEAEQDLESILLYHLEHAGVRIAESIYSRIKEQVASLTLFPQRCRPGRVAQTKEYVITRLPYVVVVYINDNMVYVLNVVHTARKYPYDAS